MNLRHITLHQFRLFNSLGEHLSFTKAAEVLHLSQPAVSIQIKRLEENIGIPLIEQVGKKIYLTHAGQELHEATNDIFDRLQALNENMLGMSDKVQGPLSIAAITTAKYFMPHLLGAFLNDYNDVNPTLTITNQSKVIQRLEENLDDIVIMGNAPDHLDLEKIKFLDNPLVVVASPEHPLANRKNIPLERIAQEKFLSREKGSGTRKARSELFAKYGLEPKTYMELGSGEAIKQGIMAGLGISVLSMHNLKLELEAGLVVTLDVEHFPLLKTWHAVHLKGKKLSNTSKRFLEFLSNDGASLWHKIQIENLRIH